MKLDLYMKPTCPFCHRVMDVITEMGVGDQITMHDVSADPTALQTLIEVGGTNQVPCLFIDGKPMYESGDIVEWLRANL
ncbi:glutaredoxin family protein [Adlercreutzia murintestinalis]|uniref:glutaredoxin family protein n=1 Tax=Adlercreutzia murintestinalis TaxID=2941325 RepID=UPI002041DCA3|nr:glutaredoxin [Adlercreutzia murintestinalis]